MKIATVLEWYSGIKLIRANFLAGLRTANADNPPSWNPGDFFGATYAQIIFVSLR